MFTVFGNKVIVVNVDGCWGQNRTLQIQSDCHWKVVYYFEVVRVQDFILSLMISINIAFAKIVVGILLVSILLENLRFVGSEWSKHTFVPSDEKALLLSQGFMSTLNDLLYLFSRKVENSITSMPRLSVIYFFAFSDDRLRLNHPIKSESGLFGPVMFGLDFRFQKIA